MTTYEWISLLAVIIGGFWTLNRQLTKIELAVKEKVSYDFCSSRQEKCPCHEQIREILENFEKFHPRKKGE